MKIKLVGWNQTNEHNWSGGGRRATMDATSWQPPNCWLSSIKASRSGPSVAVTARDVNVREERPGLCPRQCVPRGALQFVKTTAWKVGSAQCSDCSATRRTASDLVLPAPSTPATHRSDLPVSTASSRATVTARTWPSPWAASGNSVDRK